MSESASVKQPVVCTPSDYEPTPSEDLLFGERKEKPAAPVAKDLV